MRGKLQLLVGLAAGYVLGSRAGRQRYEEIKRVAVKLWNDPRVQTQVKNAEGYAKDMAPQVVDFLSDGAKKVASRGRGPSKQTPANPRAASAKPSAAE
ncbi:MAG: hypothetical protein JWM49_2619 [Microbacteriaceae bacterium]|nr:hypothetical protein [Microbacteriaceae bacterium]